jgi:hypothetical protein
MSNKEPQNVDGEEGMATPSPLDIPCSIFCGSSACDVRDTEFGIQNYQYSIIAALHHSVTMILCLPMIAVYVDAAGKRQGNRGWGILTPDT